MRIPTAYSSHDHVTRLLLATLALALSWPSYAAEIVGLVVGIADGDTITVLDAAKRQSHLMGSVPICLPICPPPSSLMPDVAGGVGPHLLIFGSTRCVGPTRIEVDC